MDLLKSCTSGVHIIDGFASIPYKVFALDKNVESTKRTCAARWDLLDTEYIVRKSGRLVTTDFKKLQLWAFEKPKSPTPPGASPALARDDLESFEPPSESSLRCIHSGEFCFSDLGDDTASAKPGDTESFPVLEVYRCFLRACFRSLALQLASEQSVIPLNTHAFIVCKSRHNELDAPSGQGSLGLHSYHIIKMKIELLDQGCLQIATSCSPQYNIRCLAESPPEEQTRSELDLPLLIYVAPSSRLARTSWGDELLSNLTKPAPSNSASYKSAEWVFSVAQERIWKNIVVKWLLWQGLDFRDQLDDQHWAQLTVFLRFPHSEDATPRSRLLTDRLTLTWPAQLCFQQNQHGKTGVECFVPAIPGHETHDGTQWFQFGDHKGFPDPLQAAISWIENSAQLQSELEARKRRLAAEKVERSTQDVAIDGFDPQSPLDGRTMTYQDGQTIYPTPSDGLPAHVTPGSTSFENGLLPSSAQPEVGSSPDFEIKETENKDLHPQRANNAITDQSFGGDDHYFGPAALTDADFDFFDQPDIDSVADQPDNMDVDEDVTRAPENSNQPSENIQHATENNGILDETKEPSMQAEATAVEESHSMEEVLELDGKLTSLDNAQDNKAVHLSNEGREKTNHDRAPETHKSPSNIGVQVQHDIKPNGTDRTSNLDDLKYLREGRFGFQPRKRPRTISSSNSFNRKRDALPTLFSSPTSIMRSSAKSGQRQDRFQSSRTTASTDDELSADDESVSSRSEIARPSSKVQLHVGSERSSNNPGVGDSTSTAAQGRPSVSGPSNNQKFWSIEDFDALAETMLMGYFKSSSNNWSLTHFLITDPKMPYRELIRETQDARDQIRIAQILADQIWRAVPTIKDSNPTTNDHGLFETQGESDISSFSYIDEAISKTFPHENSVKQDLLYFMSSPEIEDDEEDTGPELLAIAPAQVHLQRSRQSWDFASSAPAFWETLGLEPTHGPKEVSSFCVYPWSEEIESSIDAFLESMESTWLSQKLGIHKAGESVGDSKAGHAPAIAISNDSDIVAIKEALAAFSTACLHLGQSLKTQRDPEQRIVIYMINPFETTVSLKGLCGAFNTLLQAYSEDEESKERVIARNISLQIIPIELIASIEAPVFIEPEVANSLAHRVYDSCLPTETALEAADLAIPSGASIILSKPVPETIQFQLSAAPSSNVLEEDSSMHLAYCESPDRRWVAAAWTDDTGEYQHSACYHQGGVLIGGSIIKEMFDTTIEIIKPRKVHWHIFVTKASPLNPHEQKIWQALATHSQAGPHKLSLITTNTSPTLTVAIKPSVKVAFMDSTTQPAGAYSTPVSTPLPPPQLGSSPVPVPSSPAAATASTPSAFQSAEQAAAAEADTSARLIDKTDESWGIVLRRRLNAAESAVEYSPALASGYLMKRSGVGELDPPVLLEVNLVHSQELGVGAGPAGDAAKRAAHAKLLRDVLVMYRNLGLLARLRRIEGRDSCRPWHVAVAMAAAHGLGKCMN